MRWLPGLLPLTLTVAVGCATVGDVGSFESADSTAVLETDEKRLWYESGKFDEQLVNARAIYPDEELRIYLQDVVDRLYPEFQGAMIIRPFYSSEPNAFVLPNGSIYFDIGLLARLDNEAQLAAVIAHEGAHFVGRHSLRSMRSAKQKMNAVFVFEAVTGIPLVGQVIAYSSMMGYSRDLEREADAIGFQRLAAAGYAADEAKRPFQRLAREAEVMDYDMPVFFSSHPRMEERVRSFEQMEAGMHGAGERHEDSYRRQAVSAIGDSLAADLDRRDPEVVIFLLEDEGLLEACPPEYRFYLAEAYRMRSEQGDAERAEQEYTRTMATCPDFAPTHGALGLIRMQQGRDSEARDLFTRYLELDPRAPDRAYIQSYIARLKGETR